MKNKSIIAVGERQNKLFRMKFKIITNENKPQANIITQFSPDLTQTNGTSKRNSGKEKIK